MAGKQFVIWTRYERPDGKIVRHAYGPYASRSTARRHLTELWRVLDELHGTRDGAEAQVVTLLSGA